MNMTRINYVVCIHGWESICFPRMKDFSRLRNLQACSHVHRKSGSIKEMVQDRHVVTTLH